jgi:hypothetical protein
MALGAWLNQQPSLQTAVIAASAIFYGMFGMLHMASIRHLTRHEAGP